MRIALLTTNLAQGGAETQVAQLAMRLEERGHQVSVVSLVRPSAWTEELEAAGVHVFAPGLLRVPVTVRRLRPEVLHCHMFHANFAGRLLRLVLPLPAVISTIHSARETPRTSRRYWPRALAYRLTNWLADRTVSVVDEPVNGVDTVRFHPPASLPQNERFTWLAAGRLMWKKDYPTLLQAMAELPEARLLIAGAGPEEAALRAQAPSNVQFLGPRSDMPELRRGVNGFVSSSVIEGLPVVILEAMATGLPVVATDVGGIRQMQPSRLVPPRDPVALARAMREVMAAPPDAAAIRSAAVARYDWEVVTDYWLSLYRKLLDSRRW